MWDSGRRKCNKIYVDATKQMKRDISEDINSILTNWKKPDDTDYSDYSGFG